jgi:hypothetical protein
MNQDTKSFLRELIQKDPNKLRDIENFFADLIQEQQMNPEQKAALEQKRRLEEYERMVNEMHQKEHERKMSELQTRAEENITGMITKTLDAGGLPKTPFTVKRMAEQMEILTKNGYAIADIDMSMVAEKVKKMYIDDFNNFFSVHDAGAYEQLFGDNWNNFSKKIIKHHIDKYNSKAPKKDIVETSKVEKTTKKPQFKHWRDWEADILKSASKK